MSKPVSRDLQRGIEIGIALGLAAAAGLAGECDLTGPRLAGFLDSFDEALAELGAHALRVDLDGATVYLTRFDDGWHARLITGVWGATDYPNHLAPRPSPMAALLAAINAINERRELDALANRSVL